MTDRDHHRWSPAAGLSGKGGWRMTFELAEPRRVEAIRFIETRGHLKGDTNLAFDVRITTPSGERLRDAVPGVRGVWYSEMEKYIYTGIHPTLAVPVGAETDRIVLAARSNPASKGSDACQEAEVLALDPQARIRSVLRKLPSGGLLVVGGQEVACLDDDGREQWRYRADSPLVAHAVADSGKAGGVRIGLWPLSNRFVLLDGKGKELVDPSAWDAPERKIILAESSRTACMALVDGSNTLEAVLFPHYRHGLIRFAPGGPQVTFGEGRGGKAALVIPDVTGDGLDDVFVVGRHENNNGMIASGTILALPGSLDWTGNLVDNWTGWSAGNMELSLYHDASFVRGGTNLLGIAAVNPGGLDYYRWPGLDKAWQHFNHPGNLSLAAGDVTGDGADEVLVGREDGFLTVYDAATGATVWKRQLGAPVRAAAVNRGVVAAGTRRGLLVCRGPDDPLAEAPGGVESVANAGAGFIAAFSDGTVRDYESF
jgi:outer membrane protein assembly factor BamB